MGTFTDTDTSCVCARFATVSNSVSLPVSLPACLLYLMDTFGRVTIYNSTRCTTLVVPPISQYCLPLVSKLKCKCLHYLYVMYICIHTHTQTTVFPHYVCSSCAVGLKIDKLVGDNNSWLLALLPAKLELGNESKLQIIEIYVGIQLWFSIESCLTLFYTHLSLFFVAMSKYLL